jgi:hypothetical protein
MSRQVTCSLRLASYLSQSSSLRKVLRSPVGWTNVADPAAAFSTFTFHVKKDNSGSLFVGVVMTSLAAWSCVVMLKGKELNNTAECLR